VALTRLPRGRLLLTAALGVYGLYYMLVPDHFGLIDNVDLAIHETGHLVFGPFGEFIGMAGGTLLQLIFPLVFAWYFLRRGDRHAATVAAWWVAQNCWNISGYIQDAQAQELPLVGGGEHDWAYLLAELNLLEYDHTLGQLVRVAGMLIFAYAILRGVTYARQGSGLPAPDA
jgi:hypothetical protein